MYFNEKENTNIDKELNTKKGPKIKIDKKVIIIGCIVLAVAIIALIIILISINVNRYTLYLNGSTEVTIYQGSNYNDPGFNAFDNHKNDLTSEVVVQSNLDPNTIGTYTITYSLNNEVRTRTITVVEKPAVTTFIYLKGDKTIYLNVGATYTEPGYTVADAIDGDLTQEVTINGNVDTSKRGTYSIIYSVVNSSGVTTTNTRTIIVQ